MTRSTGSAAGRSKGETFDAANWHKAPEAKQVMVTAARLVEHGATEALEAARDGRLKVVVERIMALGQVNDALRLLAERKVLGKLVLDLRG